jgi:hypothetical protein
MADDILLLSASLAAPANRPALKASGADAPALTPIIPPLHTHKDLCALLCLMRHRHASAHGHDSSSLRYQYTVLFRLTGHCHLVPSYVIVSCCFPALFVLYPPRTHAYPAMEPLTRSSFALSSVGPLACLHVSMAFIHDRPLRMYPLVIDAHSLAHFYESH